MSLPSFVVAAVREAMDLELDGGRDGLVFPSTRGTPRSPGGVRQQLRLAQKDIGVDVTPHDVRRTVATQVARATTLAAATALLGHADESTTARHYVQRVHVAPDVRVVIDQLVQRTSATTASGE
ncbi:tyrosine-type recombinase/integrase [Cellulomonas fimi]|uniref:tyrosine-type recombinase/integrase n=1 Tax=Cellulomonas fimi TaxID=1708 RepID=UPI0035B3C16E